VGQPPVPYGQQYAAGPPVQQAYPYVQPSTQGQVLIRRKDRSVALVLAIFLSFFTWLYTIERDGWKFWVNLVVLVVDMVLSALTLGIWLFIAIPVGLGVWIWAIVDVAVKPRTFYDNYPAG